MTVANGSQVRLADISEATPGTIPATPAWQVMRYVSSDVGPNKQTNTPDEVRGDRNVASIVDVGRAVSGSINTFLSYGTFDTWLERLLCASWATNVLKNGVADKTGALEWTYSAGAVTPYVRAVGCRWNTLDLSLQTRQPISANWGVMGLDVPTPTTAIVTGATYLAATTSSVLNAALNVGALSVTGITSAPKLQSLSINVNNNISQNDILGQYAAYSHSLGNFAVTGRMTALFEDLDTFNAILSHSDIGLSVTMGAAANNKYKIDLPKVKLLGGAPGNRGNGQPVVMDVPWQAYFDATSGATMTITRAVA